MECYRGSLTDVKYPIVCCSIDPGVKSMGIRIETRHEEHTVCHFFDRITLDESSLYNSILDILLSLPLTLTWDLVVIEKQMSVNGKTIRVESVIIGILLMYSRHVESSMCIVGVNPRIKSRVFKSLGEKNNKRASITRSIQLLVEYSDEESAEYIEQQSKMEYRADLADTVCQLEAVLETLPK